MELQWNNHHFLLLPEKALYWIEEKTLIISDIHVGKISYFRKHGVPLPTSAIHENISQLNLLLEKYEVRKIIFTGDVFHNEFNAETEIFLDWKRALAIPAIIVKGNHDPVPRITHFPFDLYEEEFVHDPFVFTHHPSEVFDGRFYISGHIHPVFKFYGEARQSARLPCFFLTGRQLILPSFGYFTGGYEIQPNPDDTIFIINGSKVLQMTF